MRVAFKTFRPLTMTQRPEQQFVTESYVSNTNTVSLPRPLFGIGINKGNLSIFQVIIMLRFIDHGLYFLNKLLRLSSISGKCKKLLIFSVVERALT